MNDVLSALRAELHEVVYGPGDDEYADATSPNNSSYLQRPFGVVRPHSAEQAAQTVKCAWRFGFTVAVQATGPGGGREIGDDQLVLDTSALTGVTVDAIAGTARAGAGARWPAVRA